jgi:DNA-directed RNA polymerase subunit K/omega
MEIEPVDLRVIDEKASNIYEATIVIAKRARQINSENKIEYNALLNTVVLPNSEDDSEDVSNPALLKIALELEKKDKPHVQALHELLEGNIEYSYKQ